MTSSSHDLDHAATAPLDPRVREVLVEALALGGNPSSQHAVGRRARRRLEEARERCAAALGHAAEGVVFTASATEANNLALFGLARRAPPDRRRVLVSAVEHPSVAAPARRLAEEGFEVEVLPVHPSGLLDLDALAERAAADVALIALMAVNNVTGAVQPVAEAAALAALCGAPLHVDAVQALGRIARPAAPGIATAVVSGHKIGGPRGAAALLAAPGVALAPLLHGGDQERGLRPGTENVAAAAAFARAVELAVEETEERAARMRALETRMFAGFAERRFDVVLNGGAAPRAPGLCSLRFPGHVGDVLQMKLDLEGVHVGLGSACASGAIEPAPTLAAMGLRHVDNLASLRVAFGASSTPRDVDALLAALSRALLANR